VLGTDIYGLPFAGQIFLKEGSFMRCNSKYLKQLISLWGILLMPLMAHSQTASERAAEVSGDDFVRAFLGNCAQSPGDFAQVVAASKALGFADLPDEMKPLIAPQDPEAEFVGYLVQTGEAAPYFLGVSKSVVDGQSVTACTIANPYIKTAEVVSALQSFVLLRDPDDDETAMGQRFRIWFADELPQGAYILLTDAEPMGYDGATLSLLAPSIN
jgi:hypothetical protein